MWKKKKMPHLLCLLSWRQMGLPVFKSIFWLTALFCTEKDHEWHWKRVCTHARSSCQSLQTRGGEDVPTGHQFCYFHLGKSEKSKTRCILEYGISDTEKSVNMFSSLPQKPAEVCKILGLCSSCDKEQMLSYFAQEALQAAVTSDNVSIWSLERHIAGRKKKKKNIVLNSCHLCASIRWSLQPNAPSAPSSSRLWRVCFPKKEQRWNTVTPHIKTVLPCAAHRHLKAIRPHSWE